MNRYYFIKIKTISFSVGRSTVQITVKDDCKPIKKENAFLYFFNQKFNNMKQFF